MRSGKTTSAHDHVATEALCEVPAAKGKCVPSGIKWTLYVRVWVTASDEPVM